MARIVVSGYMARHPLAGNVAAFLQYVVGLSRLGHEVVYLEEKGWPGSCYDPASGSVGDFPRTGLPLVRSLLSDHCPGVPAVWLDADSGLVDGMSWAQLRERLAAADLLLDVGGLCWLEERSLPRRRALVDMDPLFTQAGRFATRLDEYDVRFSYGTNVGQPGCTVPTAGVDWVATVPPVVPELWAAPPPTPELPLTTVANWSAYGTLEHEGRSYGQKDREFDRLGDLPRRVEPTLELALSGADDGVRRRLRTSGWRLCDGAEATATLAAYHGYIAGSQAELSVAKHAYVATRSGWFSDRSVCYLAAGRPVIVQDTGTGAWLGAGRGVLTFAGADGAAEAVERVGHDLDGHSRAARLIARRTFDYRVVLRRLLERSLPRRVEAVA